MVTDLAIAFSSWKTAWINHPRSSRSSHRRCSVRKGVLRNFAKFTGKHLCQGLFFNKVADLRPATLSKMRLAQVFSCGFCEISKNTLFTEHLWTTASVLLLLFHMLKVMKITLYVCVDIKTIPWKFRILNPKKFRVTSSVKFVNFLKSIPLVLNVCSFDDVVNKLFTYLTYALSQKVKGALMWNLQHIIFIWRPRNWQIFKSVLV